MPPRRRSPLKDPKTVYELAVCHHADALAIVVGIIVLAYIQPNTQHYASPIITPQHNVTDPANLQPGELTQYSVGSSDILYLIFLTVASILLHDIYRESFSEFILRKVNTSNRAIRANLLIYMSYFAHLIITLYMGVTAMFQSFSVINPASLWAGFPHGMDWWVKLMCAFQIGYWAQRIPITFVTNGQYPRSLTKVEIQKHVFTAAGHLVVLIPLYFMNFNRFMVVAVTIDSFGQLVNVIHDVLKIYFASKPAAKKEWFKGQRSITLRDVFNYFGKIQGPVALACRVAIIGLAVFIFGVMLPLEAGHSEEEDPIQITDNNYAIIRWGILALVVAGQMVTRPRLGDKTSVAEQPAKAE